MLNLALWLKQNDFRLDQVQTFLPTPMAMATTMYHTRKNPLRKIAKDSETVETPRIGKIRKFHKALLRYHDPANWEMLREGLKRMGRAELIGNGPQHLVPRGDASPQRGSLRTETPTVATIARRHGQSRPRQGAAISRKRSG
jgi:hypothetical protein